VVKCLERKPGEDAPTAGTYELLNVLGAATGIEVALLRYYVAPATKNPRRRAGNLPMFRAWNTNTSYLH
jgi:hypothetical protein